MIRPISGSIVEKWQST
jgi:hypothetical protein